MATSTLTSIGSASSSSTSSNLAITGLASGVDWSTIVTALANAERSPEVQWQRQQSAIAAQNASYSTIKSDLTTLQNDAKKLLDPTFFNSVVASSSNSSVGNATATTGATIGNFSFNISQLATAAVLNGATYVSQVLDPGGDPSTVTIGTAGFATPIKAGVFTVNGAQVTIATTDSLKQVFDNIAAATGNKVAASYDATSDKISLTSSDGSPIVLGSATDTSNFLQVAQLYNNNSGAVSSTSALGHVNTAVALTGADLKTAVTDDGSGSGNGSFLINGVTINHNLNNDSIQNVLNNINNSAAGVNASYDVVNNRFALTNKTAGDVGISVSDVSGNFLTATGLAGGALSHGQNLLYTVNGGTQQLVSQSNTIDSSSSGINGLSITAVGTGTTAVSVGADVNTISNAIQQFVTDYNNTQNFINSQQTVATAADNTVTPGTLTGDSSTNAIVTSMRSLMSAVAGATGTSVKQLADLGFQSNGQNNMFALSNSGTLTSMLTSNLNDVKALFTDPTKGLAAQMNNFINSTIGDNGTLTARQSDLTQVSSTISTQISNLEAKIANDSNQWNSEFQAMELAQSQANQELTYLSQQVSSGAL